jgi:hypothetical protein
MSWKRQWPDRVPRPKVQSLSNDEREQLLNEFKKEIELSPVLSSLRITARALRGRFYFEKVWQISGEQPVTEIIGRVTPLENAHKELLLEVEKRSGNWYTVTQGSAIQVIQKITQDTQGTFHGLGDLDKNLRKTGGSQNRLKVQMNTDGRFVYVDTGKTCTFHETLFHYFCIPIQVIAEPRQWYIYHREPRIIEVSADGAHVLVEFIAEGISGSISGICLYALVEGEWAAYMIKPNQSQDIGTAVEWLSKREWRGW